MALIRTGGKKGNPSAIFYHKSIDQAVQQSPWLFLPGFRFAPLCSALCFVGVVVDVLIGFLLVLGQGYS